MKKWHIILVAIVVIVFAVVIYILMTPPPSEYTIYTIAQLVFDFLDKWASAGAPAIMLLSIIVALYIGIRSLHQTENTQQSEKKQRLLKEIEEWAKETIRFIDEYERGTGTRSLWYAIKWRWQILKATKATMKETAHKIDEGFGEKVEKAVRCFDALDMNIDKGMLSNVQNNLNSCRESCEEILKAAGSLKFKEIC